MLDPVQTRALEQARHRPIRVSGFPGSGRSHLARAIAEDAVRRGKSCVLVGASPVLDRPLGPPSHPVRLHPILARRAAGPIEASGGEEMPRPGDLALRAALDPDGADVALRLHRRAGEILALHPLDPIEIEAAGAPGRDPALDAALGLALADARRAAAGIWRDGLAGRTLGDLLAAASGQEAGADRPGAGIVLDRDPASVDRRLRGMAAPAEANGEGPDRALREALDPWAFRPELHEVGEAQAWADRQAELFEGVADLLRRAGSFAAAEGAGDASEMALRTLGVLRSRFPERSEAEAIAACDQLGRLHREQARGLDPFLPAHGGRSVQSLRDLPAVPRHRARPPEDPQPVREAHLALRRFVRAADGLAFRMDPDRWRTVLAADPESLRDGIPDVPPDGRARAAIEMRQIREAFADLGYGDILAAGDFPGSVAGAVLPARAAARPGTSPSFLDLLLPRRTGVAEASGPEGAPILRVRGPGDIGGLGDDYDVVVIDDEAHVDDAVMAAIDGIGSLTHAIGVEAGDADGLVLTHPHLQRDAALANVAAGMARSPFWLGCPRGAGIVVRQLRDADRDRLAAAASELAAALAGADYDAGILDAGSHGGTGADIVVAFAEEADDALLRRAAGSARDGVVLVCARLTASLPDILDVGDHAGLAAHGWSLAVDVGEGRIFTRDGKSAVLVREPAWNDLAAGTIVERLDRISGLGWAPVVDWIGAPRDPAELSDLLAAAAVAPDPRMRRIMEGHPLQG